MERIWWLPLTLLVVVGCQSQPPMNNPFQTTVPAPGTAGTAEAPLFGGAPSGQMAPSSTGTYIPSGTVTPAAPSSTLGAPTYSPPVYTPPTNPVVPSVPNTPNNQYYPPGNSFDMRQSSLSRSDIGTDLAGGPMPETAPVERLGPTGAEFNPRRRRRTTSPTRSSSPVGPQSEMVALVEPESHSPPERDATADPVDRIQFPQPDSITGATKRSNSGTELRIVHSSEVAQPTETSNTAVAADEAAGREYQVARQDDSRQMEIMRASFNQPIASADHQPPPTAAGFDHDPNYQSLQGKLEYSQSTRQWKLRYIPIDGDTDRFGGSVILSDSDLLGGYRPGEFVSIRGSLSESQGTTKGYAPHYEVEQIRRQNG